MSNDENQIERVEFVAGEDRNELPRIGDETVGLLSRASLEDEDRTNLQNEAVAIFESCIRPNVEGQTSNTGLVVGYVQSGKTMSFTTVAALARDNGFPLVIVIAGTSIPLRTQSEARLRKDLRLDERTDFSWRHLSSPSVDAHDHDKIAAALEDWRDETVPLEEKQTILVTVMKQHQHLRKLIRVLESIDLSDLPVLIIDDEADQAGLNNLINEGDESTTYSRIRSLRNTIPCHTFLQYTATPQGPLLINIIDVLSPDFGFVLTPGNQYVGGRTFFAERNDLVRIIPPTEIPTRDSPLDSPPSTLIHALAYYYLLIALDSLSGRNRSGNRSMMIHPSRITVGHQQYYDWVVQISNLWRDLLNDHTDNDCQDVLEVFRSAHRDLQTTAENVDGFEAIAPRLQLAIRRTDIHLINAAGGRTPEVAWRDSYAHILVGGQALDRGFTVEGLTVTYMPRGVGSRRADTVQQRARFFGYKRSQLDFCRIYLESEVADAFQRYVSHEEDVRTRLIEHHGRPLGELRRVFLLPRGMAPTRDSILDIDYLRARVREGWFYPRSPHESEDAVATNQDTIQEYLNRIELIEDEGHPDRTSIQRHQVAQGLDLNEFYQDVLLELRFPNLSDAQNFLAVLVLLRSAIDQGEETFVLYNMSSGESRDRSVNDNNQLRNLFQGAAPVNPPERRGEVYPGDRSIHPADLIGIQIHWLNLRASQQQESFVSNVVCPAIWIPPRLSNDVLIQEQGGEDDGE